MWIYTRSPAPAAPTESEPSLRICGTSAVVPSFMTSLCLGLAERMYQMELIAFGLLMKSVLRRLVSDVPAC